MSPKLFVERCFDYALTSESKTGINAIAILAQAAWESGWGKYAPGNMYFGVKDTDGINGNEQLLVTHEYSKRIDARFKNIIKVEPIVINGVKMYKYTIKDYFRKYDTPEECFTDHCNFLLSNARYSQALKFKAYPELFLTELARSGYATDPNYANNLVGMVKVITRLIPKNKPQG